MDCRTLLVYMLMERTPLFPLALPRLSSLAVPPARTYCSLRFCVMTVPPSVPPSAPLRCTNMDHSPRDPHCGLLQADARAHGACHPRRRLGSRVRRDLLVTCHSAVQMKSDREAKLRLLQHFGWGGAGASGRAATFRADKAVQSLTTQVRPRRISPPRPR